MRFGLKVLVVIGDTNLRESLGEIIEIFGYSALTASNGIEGLAIAKAHVPDLMIIDDNIAGLSSRELAKELRKDPGFANAGLILTASRPLVPEVAESIYDAGFNDILTKPFVVEDLEHMMEDLAERTACDKFTKGSALILHDETLDYAYVSQICAALHHRTRLPIIALPSRADASGRNRNLLEALRASRSLTLCATEDCMKRDQIRFAYEFFNGHQRPLTAILYEDVELPDAFNMSHTFKPDELEQYSAWLARTHKSPSPVTR